MSNPHFCEQCRNTGTVSCFSPWIVVGLTKGMSRVEACGCSVAVYRADGRVNWQRPVSIPCKCKHGDAHTIWMSAKTGQPRNWNSSNGEGHVEQHRFGEKWWHVRHPEPDATATDDDIVGHIQKCVDDWNAKHGKRTGSYSARPDATPTDNDLNSALQEL